MSSPWIWSGNLAKSLKQNLNLGDQAYVLSGSVNPTITATLAPPGSIYIYNVSGTAAIYMKQDAGSTTNWQPILTNLNTTALEIEDSMRAQQIDSPYALMNPYIVATQGNAQIATFTGSSSYDSVTKTILYPTSGTSLTVSTNQLDAVEFLNSSILTDVASIDLTLYFSPTAIDSSPTVQVSRDGGTNYTTMTMTRVGSATEVFYGNVTFATEATKTTLYSNALSSNNTIGLTSSNSTNTNEVANQYVVASGAAAVFQQINWTFGTSVGSPVGNLYVMVVKDSAGVPSVLAADVLATSGPIAASTVSGTTQNFAIPNTLLGPGTYWVVLFGDSTYVASYASNYVMIPYQSTGTTSTAGNSSASPATGVSWTTLGAGSSWKMAILGRNLDVRIKYTTGTSGARLNGWNTFYGLLTPGVVGYTKKIQTFVFDGPSVDQSTFALNFSPDPDLIRCYVSPTGQVLTARGGDFSVQGQNAIFPAHTFNNGGISQTWTLVFDQNTGGSFDNSDLNARLLAANHLGSTAGGDDRSSAGRGVYLRNASGVLRELALDANDNIIILSTP